MCTTSAAASGCTELRGALPIATRR
jgi:hypothetical protein